MTIVYPINGKNERLGELFTTPKHLLLYRGVPALKASTDYMKAKFPGADILLIVNERYLQPLSDFGIDIKVVSDTDSQIETLRQVTLSLTGPVMFVDCDIVPIELNEPVGNTVYLFENKQWLKHYSNYQVLDGLVTDCNEKGEYLPYAGAGIYYFESVSHFNALSRGHKSISEVIKRLPFHADITSRIFRFGTLNDIKNDEQLVNRIY